MLKLNALFDAVRASPVSYDCVLPHVTALTGNGRYIEEVERIIGRRIEHRRPRRLKQQQHK